MKGFTVGFAAGSPEVEIQHCAGCHSLREAFGDGNPLPGTGFHDAYRLVLLREGLYHADGTIEDEYQRARIRTHVPNHACRWT